MTVTCMPTTEALNKQQTKYELQKKFHSSFAQSCRLTVHTYQKHMPSPTASFFGKGKALFGCSLPIQAVTFCFEGQEMSIKALIS